MTKRDQNIALAVCGLGLFWYGMSKVDPQPKWIRWATWW